MKPLLSVAAFLLLASTFAFGETVSTKGLARSIQDSIDRPLTREEKAEFAEQERIRAVKERMERERLMKIAETVEWHAFRGRDKKSHKGKFLEVASDDLMVVFIEDEGIVKMPLRSFFEVDQAYLRKEIKKRSESVEKKVNPKQPARKK